MIDTDGAVDIITLDIVSDEDGSITNAVEWLLADKTKVLTDDVDTLSIVVVVAVGVTNSAVTLSGGCDDVEISSVEGVFNNSVLVGFRNDVVKSKDVVGVLDICVLGNVNVDVGICDDAVGVNSCITFDSVKTNEGSTKKLVEELYANETNDDVYPTSDIGIDGVSTAGFDREVVTAVVVRVTAEAMSIVDVGIIDMALEDTSIDVKTAEDECRIDVLTTGNACVTDVAISTEDIVVSDVFNKDDNQIDEVNDKDIDASKDHEPYVDTSSGNVETVMIAADVAMSDG